MQGPRRSSMQGVLVASIGAAIHLFSLCKGSVKGELTLHREQNVIYK